MKKTFKFEKETKNTIRFQEVTDDSVMIGPVYIQKEALKEIGYKEGKDLEIEVKIKE